MVAILCTIDWDQQGGNIRLVPRQVLDADTFKIARAG